MENVFITFIILADSLEDPALLRTVTSLRQQDEFSWSLEVRLPDITDETLKIQFTHDNPRISVICNEGDRHRTAGSSEVLALLPRGIELFSSACGDLKREFTQNEVDIVLANIILFTKPRTDSNPKQSQDQFFITAIRRQDFLNDSILIREISPPVGKLNEDALTPVRSRNTKTPDHIRDKTIRAQYIFDLEEENLILTAQLRYLAPRAETMKLAEDNLFVLRNRLANAMGELQSIRNSRTWRVGRLVLFPFRAFKCLTRTFLNR
jgi:hypothetical protein